jgi:hypothetical protein
MQFKSDHAIDITPSDSADLSVIVDKIYVGTTGALKVDTVAGDTVTFVAVPVGIFNPGCRIKKVYSTGTAAGSLIGIY